MRSPCSRADYPGSSALLSAQGRLAGYYARTGRAEPALVLYREIVAANVRRAATARRACGACSSPISPCSPQRGEDPAAVADLFAASQVLVRPGVAQTQAVLARELSGGSDEAARLFRQSVDLTRDIERGRVELARLEAAETPTAAGAARIAELRASLAQWQQDQVATQARLAEFPRYRVVSGGALQLADLQQLLRPGEAYYKMIVVGDDAYAIFATSGGARAFRIGATPAELDRQVDALRATISIVEDDQQLTYPFDLELAHGLYQSLFGPVAAEVAADRAPDLRAGRGDAPAAAQPAGHGSGRDRRLCRAPPRRHADDDGFDFRGIQWLGRERDISTAVSVRAFRDVRRAPPSRARAEYLGFGQNAPAQRLLSARDRGRARRRSDPAGCSWSLSVWNRPISARELVVAGDGGRPGPGRRSRDRHRRGLHRHRDHGPRRPRPIPHPPFRHPRPGHAAAAGMPGAAGAC